MENKITKRDAFEMAREDLLSLYKTTAITFTYIDQKHLVAYLTAIFDLTKEFASKGDPSFSKWLIENRLSPSDIRDIISPTISDKKRKRSKK